MNTINKLISKFNFNSGNVSRIKYIVIHYVGALGGAKANCEYYAGGDRGASAHYYVGFDGEIWQSVEDANIAWHCGANSYKHAECRNANSIGIEMCVRKKNTATMNATDKDWYFEDQTVQSAIELTKYLMDKYNVPAENVIRHYDVTGKICPNPYVYNTGIHTWDEFKSALTGANETTEFVSEADFVAKVGKLATADMQKTSILASVTTAQAILESGYGSTELAKNANNFFGMKTTLSGNSWEGSSWDGVSVYTKQTKEQDVNGKEYTVTADFRKYPSIADSLADHSAYLLGAMNGNAKRYDGLKGEKDYKTAITIIKNGGYATDTKYIDKICNIIERWNLTQYDVNSGTIEPETEEPWYRVRKTWTDAKTQKGAFHDLAKAKACADANSGYYVFDENGNAIYPEIVEKSIPEKAAEWAIATANDDTHGYDNRKAYRGGNPDYACSSFVNEAYRQAGVDLPESATVYTAKMKSIYTSAGFEDVTSKITLKSGKGLEVGDIVLTPGKHVEIYVGDGKLAGARGDANSGKAENGKAGDQTGSEIAVINYWNYPWTVVLRYAGEEKTVSNVQYRVQAGSFSVKKNADALLKKLKNAGFDAFIVESGGLYKIQAGAYSVKENAENMVKKLKAAGFDAFVTN